MSNPFRDISARGARLAMLDLRDLRVRYCRMLHVAFYRAGQLKRHFMVDKILELEFGDRFHKYAAHCKVWRNLEQKAIDSWLKSLDLDDAEPA